MKELIRKLTSISSPSGREEQVRAVIKEEIASSVDEIYEDEVQAESSIAADALVERGEDVSACNLFMITMFNRPLP